MEFQVVSARGSQPRPIKAEQAELEFGDSDFSVDADVRNMDSIGQDQLSRIDNLLNELNQAHSTISQRSLCMLGYPRVPCRCLFT